MCADCTENENKYRMEILQAKYGKNVKTDEHGNIEGNAGVDYDPHYFSVQAATGGALRFLQKRTDKILTLDGVHIVESHDIIMIDPTEIPKFLMTLLDVLGLQAVHAIPMEEYERFMREQGEGN